MYNAGRGCSCVGTTDKPFSCDTSTEANISAQFSLLSGSEKVTFKITKLGHTTYQRKY